MKKYLILLVTIVMAMSCNKTFIFDNDQNYIAYQSNAAKFSVKNLRTNDTLSNYGLSIFSDALEVNRNDSLLFVYQAPERYASSKFSIAFQAFGEEYRVKDISGNQPYQRIIVVKPSLADSSYLIQCEAVSNKWMEGSYDKGYVIVRVLE